MRIEFYLIDAMEILHFAPVVSALREMDIDTRFVSCRGTANASRNWYDWQNAEALMTALQLPFVSKPDPYADLAITTQRSWNLRDYRRLRARFNYGPMLTSTFLSSSPSLCKETHAGFDLYLLHGRFNRRYSERFVPAKSIRTIGYPRFDEWFKHPLDSAEVRRKFGLSGKKPIVAYLPTWEHRSSIDIFADAIFALSADYDVLVKPHHCTYRMEFRRMKKLSSGPVRLAKPTVPPSEPYAAADVVVVDASSGALAEAILLNRRIVGIAAKGELEELLLPELKDQILFCGDPQDLCRCVEDASQGDCKSAGFQSIRKEIFDTTEGNDALRAASEIRTFIEESQARRSYYFTTELTWRKRNLTEDLIKTADRIKHPMRTVNHALRRAGSGGLAILTYHHIGPLIGEDPFRLTVSPEQFERQMKWLATEAYQTILPSEWIAAKTRSEPLPETSVMLTFDDGYADNVEYAFPVLERYGFKAAVFVVTQRLGMTNTWDKSKGLRTHRIMNVDQVRRWANRGIEFGSHTRTHPDLSTISAGDLDDEIRGSAEDLREILGVPVLAFAYPFGTRSAEVERFVSRSYEMAFSCEQGLNHFDGDQLWMRRTSVTQDDSGLEFAARAVLGRNMLRDAFLPYRAWRRYLRSANEKKVDCTNHAAGH